MNVNTEKRLIHKPAGLFACLAAAALALAIYLPYQNHNSAKPTEAAAEKIAPTPEVKAEEKIAEKAPEVKAEPQVAVVAPPAKVEVEPVAKVEAPTFDTVRVEADGSAIIAGRAQPGTEVFATLDGEVIGMATASTDGAFVILPAKALPEGSGSIALMVKNGAESVVSANQIAVAVKPKADGKAQEALVALVQPEGATKVIQVPGTKPVAATKVVKLDSVDYDTQGNIIFSGRSEKGSMVRLYIDNEIVGEVQVDAGGAWSYKGTSTVAAGTHTLRADEVGSDGLVKSRVELPFLREEQSKVAAIETTTPQAELGPDRVVIQPGNSLWKLSRVIYGKGKRYTVIYEANKDQIRNPNKIYPGQIFTAPKAIQ